jgi:hypothetical protein
MICIELGYRGIGSIRSSWRHMIFHLELEHIWDILGMGRKHR